MEKESQSLLKVWQTPILSLKDGKKTINNPAPEWAV